MGDTFVAVDTGFAFLEFAFQRVPLLRHPVLLVEVHAFERMAYWHETYDVSDWAIDGVDVDTVARLLAFGEDNGSYDIDVVKLSLAYTFF